jgi:hypothetical protein
MSDQPEFDTLDVKIFNLLRCEPPTLAFDFFSYGGLPRSVLRHIQNIHDLETRIEEKAGKVIEMPTRAGTTADEPPLSSPESRRHIINYNLVDVVYSIMVNSHNNFSGQSDFKLFATSNNGRYQANLVVLEVYRQKGDGHPIWEVGLYITEKGKSNILYAEETIVDVPKEIIDRIQFQRTVCELTSSLKDIDYDASHKGRNRNPRFFNYLHLPTDQGIRIIQNDEFEQRRAKWLRYLVGTLDIEKVVKFEDRCGYTDAHRIYRVEIVSTHLTGDPDGKYLIEIFAQTEGKEHDPRNRNLQEGPYTHSQARSRFLAITNTYLNLLHINAEKGEPQFEITEEPTHIDFRYATVVKDQSEQPITLSSWESRYNHSGLLLPTHQRHHYLLLHNSSPEPLRLEEGQNFPQGQSPREFMAQLIGFLESSVYDHSTFIETAAQAGLPLTVSQAPLTTTRTQ